MPEGVALGAGPLEAGGVATYAENLVRGLVGAGVRVDLIGPGAAAGLLAGRKPDLVHALSPEAWQPIARIARRLGLRTVVTAHEFVNEPADLPWAIGSAPRVIAPSEALRENLVNAGGVPKPHVAVVRPGLDLAQFVPPPETDDREHQTGAPRGPHEGATKVVGCLTDLLLGRGVALFVNAAKRIVDAAGTIEFVIAGSGPVEGDLRRLARKLGVRDRLAFVGALRAAHDADTQKSDIESLSCVKRAGGEAPAAELMRNFDVLVAPSPREAVCYPALVAMASSRPVVAAAAGAAFEVVRDGVTGLLFRPGDGRGLAAKVLELLGDDRRRVEMGRAGREVVEKEFALARMTEGTLAVYQEAGAPIR